jgi:hypothetical protein
MARFIAGGIGALVGGGALGPVLGSTPLGGALFAISLFDTFFGETPKSEVGKLQDRTYSGSSYNVPIPRVWGKAKVGGNVFWLKTDSDGNYLSDVVTTESVGGSKLSRGQEVTTHNYYATAAVLFCQATLFMPDPTVTGFGTLVNRNPVIKRIWASGNELVYDATVTPIVDKFGIASSIHGGSETQTADGTIAAAMIAGETPSYRGTCYAVFPSINVNEYGKTLPQLSAEVWTDTVSLADILSDLFGLCGVPASKIDVTQATSTPVTGFVLQSQQSGQNAIQQLLDAYSFTVIDLDGKLTIIAKTGGSATAIPDDWLGASSNGKVNKIHRTKKGCLEKNAKISVGYYDVNSQFAQSVENAYRINGGIGERSIQTQLSLAGYEAQIMADRELDREYLEAEELSFNLPMAAITFAPGDVKTVTTDQGTVTIRIDKLSLMPVGEIQVTGTITDSSITTQAVNGSTGNGGSTPIPIVPSVFLPFSAREILDSHSASAGFYVAASGGPGWSSATVWYLPPGATEWIQGPTLTDKAVFGVTSSVLSASGAVAGSRDTTNTVGVSVGSSYGSLSTIEDASADSGNNWCWIGNEIAAFSTATLVSAGNYTLSRILRGLRSTVMTGHASGERFVLASNGSAIARIQVPDSAVGTTYAVKVVSAGQVLADVTAQNVTIIARTPTAGEVAIAKTLTPNWFTPESIALTQDGAWHTVSCSSAVPTGAKALIAYIEFNNSSGSTSFKSLEVRQGSGYQSYKVASSASGASSDTTATGYPVVLPVGKTFDYKLPSGWTVTMDIQGYYISAA